jgi:hypothetical protein
MSIKAIRKTWMGMLGIGVGCMMAIPSTASADTPWGPRAGFRIDPDQFVIGAHARLGSLAEDLHFQPNAELGIGDDVTIFSFSFPLHYYFDTTSEAKPYVGGGVTIGIWSHNDDSDVELSGDVIGGVEWTPNEHTFLAEFKIGIGDLYDAEIVVGMML